MFGARLGQEKNVGEKLFVIYYRVPRFGLGINLAT